MDNQIESLTAKNKEYFHAVTKQLILAGKSDEEVKTILNEILPKIIEGQKTNTPAKKLLGTPTEFAAQYQPESQKTAVSADKNTNDKPVLMWLDSTLLFMGVMFLINGVLSMFNHNARTYGLVTTLVMAALAGLVMYLIYRYYYRQEAGKRRWNWKSLLLVVVVIIFWSGLSIITTILPQQFNPVFNPYVTVAIGVVILVIKFFLKRQLHIRSTLAPAASSANTQK